MTQLAVRSKTTNEWRAHQVNFREKQRELTTKASIMAYAQRHDCSGFNVRWAISKDTTPKILAILDALRSEQL